MDTAESPNATGHGEVFGRAVEVLESGCNLELVGDPGSGRTHLLRKIGQYFRDHEWQVIEVDGIGALEFAPLMALAVAGLVEAPSDRSSALTAAFHSMEERVHGVRTVLLVDDADQLDTASWGLLSALSLRLGVPLAFARVPHRRGAQRPWSRNRMSDTITIPIPSMGYSELQSHLEAAFGRAIAPSTLSRLFAESGGSIGVATAILRAGISAGVIIVEDGVLYPAGSLWTPTLRSIVEDMVRWLPTEELEGLRLLSLFGPVDLDSARRMLSGDTLLRLEEANNIRIVEGDAGGIVVVHPPIVADYFRHESLPGQRAAAFSSVGDLVSAESALDGAAVSGADGTALFVRLVHEHTRQRTLRAREQWNTERSLPAATELLRALDADPSQDSEDVTEVTTEADELWGSAADQADWELARALHTAYNVRRPAQAVAQLRAAAKALPAQSQRLEAEAMGIEISTGRLPLDVPFAEVNLDALDRLDRIAVLRVKSHWFLVQGRVREAADLLEGRYSPTLDDSRLDAVYIQVMFAMGRVADGLRHARRFLVEARAEFDGPRFRAYSLLSVWGEVLRGEVSRLSADLDAAVAVGAYPGEPSWAVIGLAMLNAYVALQQGDADTARQLVAGTDGTDSADSPMLGFQRGFLVEKLAEAEGDPAEIEEASTIVGESLWERGARLAAATIYLEGLRAEPGHGLWNLVKSRMSEIDSPMIERWVELFEAVFSEDVVAAVGVVRNAASSGEPPEAVRMASVALRAIRRSEFADEFPAAMDELELLTRHGRPRSSEGSGRLTKQESEIAELVAAGFSNPMIAQTLLISVRTVQSHIAKILDKVGSAEREGIRAYILANGERSAE